jgi:acetyl-CoA carboxylase carboxyltransferase component
VRETQWETRGYTAAGGATTRPGTRERHTLGRQQCERHSGRHGDTHLTLKPLTNPSPHLDCVRNLGQVFFPDSAYKTAQAISDFNFEGLPLIIFANWRGFAGGLRDMFGEVRSDERMGALTA